MNVTREVLEACGNNGCVNVEGLADQVERRLTLPDPGVAERQRQEIDALNSRVRDLEDKSAQTRY